MEISEPFTRAVSAQMHRTWVPVIGKYVTFDH